MRVGALACALFFAACGGPVADVGEVEEGVRVCAKGMVTRGVDVSHYDGTIDWAKVKAAGIDFAFMKATENLNFVDPTFATNWTNAGTAGVIRGAYHFFRASVDGAKQAEFFVQTTGLPEPGDLPPVI